MMRLFGPPWTVLPALCLLACAAPHLAPLIRAYPGSLVPSTDIPGAFLLRQQVVARYPGHTMSFEALVQNQGGVLTVVALTPFGTRAFVLRQRGTEVESSTYIPRAMPFPPRYMLLDIQRVLFLGLGAGTGDGERIGQREGEEIRESWTAGRLMDRQFRRLDGDPPGTIDVHYLGGMEGNVPPRVIEYSNPWLGYTLTITTLARQIL